MSGDVTVWVSGTVKEMIEFAYWAVLKSDQSTRKNFARPRKCL